MVTPNSWHRLLRRLGFGRDHADRSFPFVLGIFSAALLCGLLQVGEVAFEGRTVHQQARALQAALALDEPSRNVEAAVLSPCVLELPPASVEAISL